MHLLMDQPGVTIACAANSDAVAKLLAPQAASVICHRDRVAAGRFSVDEWSAGVRARASRWDQTARLPLGFPRFFLMRRLAHILKEVAVPGRHGRLDKEL